MKELFLVFSLGFALFASQSAFADHQWNPGFNHWGFNDGGFNNWGYNSRGYNRGYRAGFNRGFYGSRRFRGNYWNVSFGNFGPRRGYGWVPYRYRRWDAGDVVGGIVLGSLVTSSLNNHNHHDSGTYDRVVYRSSSPATTSTRRVITTARRDRPINSGRKLLRDLEGRCYEITRNRNGDEVRTELDPSICNY